MQMYDVAFIEHEMKSRKTGERYYLVRCYDDSGRVFPRSRWLPSSQLHCPEKIAEYKRARAAPCTHEREIEEVVQTSRVRLWPMNGVRLSKKPDRFVPGPSETKPKESSVLGSRVMKRARTSQAKHVHISQANRSQAMKEWWKRRKQQQASEAASSTAKQRLSRARYMIEWRERRKQQANEAAATNEETAVNEEHVPSISQMLDIAFPSDSSQTDDDDAAAHGSKEPPCAPIACPSIDPAILRAPAVSRVQQEPTETNYNVQPRVAEAKFNAHAVAVGMSRNAILAATGPSRNAILAAAEANRGRTLAAAEASSMSRQHQPPGTSSAERPQTVSAAAETGHQQSRRDPSLVATERASTLMEPVPRGTTEFMRPGMYFSDSRELGQRVFFSHGDRAILLAQESNGEALQFRATMPDAVLTIDRRSLQCMLPFLTHYAVTGNLA